MAAAEVQESVGGEGGEKGEGRGWVEDGRLALVAGVVDRALVGAAEEGRAEERSWGCQLRRSARTKARKAHHAAAQVAVERSSGMNPCQIDAKL